MSLGASAPSLAAILSRAPVFCAMSAEHLTALASRASTRPMTAGEHLFQRGDPGSAMLVVITGEVRIVLPSLDGREQVLRMVQPGEVFGEMAVLDGGKRSADAVAHTDGRLLQLDRRDIMMQMRATPELAVTILGVLSERLRATSWLLEAMLFHDAGARLATILLALTQGQAGRRVTITQSALGDRIGTTRETVNRRLRELQTEGVLALEPGRITVLDPAALRRLAPPTELAEGAIPQLW